MSNICNRMTGTQRRRREDVENPQSWGVAEHVVQGVLNECAERDRTLVVGLSRARMICDALRRAGLLREEEAGE